MKNKRLLIGVALGVAIAYILHRRNKSLKDKIQQEQKPVEPKEEMSTDKDAYAYMDKLQQLGFMVRVAPEKRKAFVKEYTETISKEEHNRVMSILAKPRTKWNIEEIAFYEDNFLNPLLVPEAQGEEAQ